MARLPVPPLAQTCELYLKTLRPLVSPAELEENVRLVADFTKPLGQGEALQNLLLQHAAKEHNWLEKWWDNGYLDIRKRGYCCVAHTANASGETAAVWVRCRFLTLLPRFRRPKSRECELRAAACKWKGHFSNRDRCKADCWRD